MQLNLNQKIVILKIVTKAKPNRVLTVEKILPGFKSQS
jgi:hypothetical protein